MKINKSWFFLILSQLIFSIVIVICSNIGLIVHWVSGILGIILLTPIVLKVVKENKLFTPIMPIIIFDVSYYFYIMKLVNTYEMMGLEKQLLLMFCSFVWKLIAISSHVFVNRTSGAEIATERIHKNNFFIIITVLFIIAVSAMLFEWKMAGGIPALRDDAETFRFTVSYSSITHLLAIMNKIVAALIGIYFVNKGRITLGVDTILLFEMIVSEILMLGTSMRGEAILAPCVIFIVYAIKKKLPIKVYVLGGVAALAYIGFMPYLRMFNSYGASYVISLQRISNYPNIYFLTPLYQSFTNNFDILNIDFSIFPNLRNFGYGIYSILPEIPFMNLGSSLMKVQNEVLNNNFYSGLTATFLASWYADFGVIGCIGITALYAKITTHIYERYIKERSLYSLALYAYTFYSSLWIFYNGVFNFVFLCYTVIIWMTLKLKYKV